VGQSRWISPTLRSAARSSRPCWSDARRERRQPTHMTVRSSANSSSPELRVGAAGSAVTGLSEGGGARPMLFARAWTRKRTRRCSCREAVAGHGRRRRRGHPRGRRHDQDPTGQDLGRGVHPFCCVKVSPAGQHCDSPRRRQRLEGAFEPSGWTGCCDRTKASPLPSGTSVREHVWMRDVAPP